MLVCHAPTIIIPTGAEYINETEKRKEKREREKKKERVALKILDFICWKKRTRKK